LHKQTYDAFMCHIHPMLYFSLLSSRGRGGLAPQHR
jgi:hypothetical protein